MSRFPLSSAARNRFRAVLHDIAVNGAGPDRYEALVRRLTRVFGFRDDAEWALDVIVSFKDIADSVALENFNAKLLQAIERTLDKPSVSIKEFNVSKNDNRQANIGVQGGGGNVVGSVGNENLQVGNTIARDQFESGLKAEDFTTIAGELARIIAELKSRPESEEQADAYVAAVKAKVAAEKQDASGLSKWLGMGGEFLKSVATGVGAKVVVDAIMKLMAPAIATGS